MNKAMSAQAFIDMLIETGVKDTAGEVTALLEKPPIERKVSWETVNSWYRGLTAEEQGFVHFLVRQGAITSLFHVLVDIDGASGYHEVGGKVAEFGVELIAYRDLDKAMSSEAEQVIRIAPANEGEDLHDLFMNTLDDLGLNAL